MRIVFALLTATSLAGCGGGGGPQTLSGNAVTAVPGSSSGSAAADPYAQFVTPTVPKTYSGIGASQTYSYLTDDRDCCGQQAQLFAGNASSVRDSKMQITYDPREAVFTLTVTDPLSGAATNTRYQDPASRTDFGGLKEPQWGVPNLANPATRYLQAGDGNPLSPFSSSGNGSVNRGTNTLAPDGATGSSYQSTNLFYEVPGTRTKFVTFTGYLRNQLSWNDIQLDDDNEPATAQIIVHTANWKLERGVFAYGIATDVNQVPKTGTGTFTGGMLASMVYNPTLDGAYGPRLPTYFQWIEGSATTTVNFANLGVTLALSGTVTPPSFDYYTGPNAVTIAAGTSFTASGTATINLINTGGFTGQFQSASFGATTNGAPTALPIAGSSIDGAFFGPKAEEVGGGFRIVGGTPDQRIDITGAFTGKAP